MKQNVSQMASPVQEGSEANDVEQTINFGGKTIVIAPKKVVTTKPNNNNPIRTAKVVIDGFGEFEATATETFSKKGNPCFRIFLVGGQPLFGSGIFRLLRGKIQEQG
jgi:hypothetical protein